MVNTNRGAGIAREATASNGLESQADALACVGKLLEGIRQRADDTDKNRRVAQETVDELLDSGLFSVVTPKIFGGADLGFATLIKVTAEIASVCGSSGWVYGVLAGHSWLLNLFPLEAQQETLGKPGTLTATIFRLGGSVVPVDGGYRLRDGEGRFCSGIDFADWIIVGNTVQLPNGEKEPRFFVLPSSDVEVIDDWHTVGMRGTGSRSVRIREAFIPEHRSVALSDMIGGSSPGADYHEAPIFRMPFSDVAPFSIVGAPIGMALGAIKLYVDDMTGRLANADDLMLANSGAALNRLAVAQSEIEAGLQLVIADAETVDGILDPTELTALDRARLPRNWAFAVQKARASTNHIFEIAGGSGIYNYSKIQRFWRDVNSSAQHFAFGQDSAMINFGRTMVGKSPDMFALKKRKR